MEHQSLVVELNEGLVVTLVGLALVFLTLTLLFLLFSYVMPVVMKVISKKPKKIVIKNDKQEDQLISSTKVSGEVNAVIAAAIYQYLEEAHDDEATILTILKVKKAYSPWSSKIYSVHGSQLNR